MSSKRRRRKLAVVAVSRAAAAPKPQGPVTPEIIKSRTASSVCLSNENPADFLRLHESLIAEHAPATPTELFIVEELAVTRWRLQRSWVMETALIDTQMDDSAKETDRTYESIDHPTRATLAYRKLTDTTATLDNLHHFDAGLSRQFDRCLRRLKSLRASAKTEFPSEPQSQECTPRKCLTTSTATPFRGSPAASRGPRVPVLSRPPCGSTQVVPIHRDAQRPDNESESGLPPAVPRVA